ncbi:MAG: hypothetical protein WDA41_08475 [Candidatus Neomarinimicrobiota bacterium]|jgi:hypothetical protein
MDKELEIILQHCAMSTRMIIDKNLLFVAVSIRSMALCVKNILPQDVVCGANEHGEGVFRPPYFEENFSPFGFVTCKTGIFPGIQADLSVTP